MSNMEEILGSDSVIIKKKEHILSVVLRFFKNVTIFLLLSVILSYILYITLNSVIIVVLLNIILIIWIVLYIKIFYDNTFLLVTDKKIIKSVRNWLFSSHIIELPLERIRQIRANNNGIIAKMFWYGDLEIQGFEESSNMYFRSMKWNTQTMRDISKLLWDKTKN